MNKQARSDKRWSKAHWLMLCLVLLGLTGCATSVRRGANPNGTILATKGLPSEMDIPLLAELKITYDRLPWHVTMVPTDRDGRVLRVAVYETAETNSDSLVILVHGVMASHLTWRYVAANLARDHQVWMVDLPGCGASEKPSPSCLPSDGYGPTALADRLLQAIAARLAIREPDHRPRSVVLVGHSLGGTVALRGFDEPGLRARHAETLKQINELVLLAPSDVAIHAEIPTFRSIVDLKGWKVEIGGLLGLVGRATRAATRDGYHVSDRATKEAALELQRILTCAETRHAAQAMLAGAVPWSAKEHRPDWPCIRQLVDLYDNVDVPCLILWDETLPASMGHKLKDEIPGASLVELPGCGHALAPEKRVAGHRLDVLMFFGPSIASIGLLLLWALLLVLNCID